MKVESRKRLVRYFKANLWRLIAGGILGAVVTSIDFRVLQMLAPFFEVAKQVKATGHANPHSQIAWVTVRHIALLFVVLQVPKGIAAFGQFYLISAATNRMATDIREEMYTHLHKFSLSFFERNRIGHLMSRMTNDVGLVQNGAGSVIDAMTAPMYVIGGVASMFVISWKLSIIALVFVPMIGWLISKITRKIRKLTMTVQLKLADVAAVLEETMSGIRVVKSFGMEAHEIRRFSHHNRESLRAALKSARRNAAVTPVTELVGSMAVAAILLVGGWLVVTGGLNFGQFAVFAGIGFYVSSNAKKIGKLNVTYHQMMTGVDRIFETLDEQPDIVDSADATDIGNVEGRVEFRNTCFSYQTGEQVLTDVSFVMEPGKAVAFVGPSGAGKSTIANLVPRFYEVSGGAVLVDGHDVRDVTMESLRRHIGIVPQETILFSGTIRDNIAYGKQDATDDEVEQAARAANAHSFITQFDNGYHTIIGERGARLSGGEKQRIAIARAILKDPKILILDEATSSLDATSERLVQEALDKLMQGRTTLVIAHRLSTITKADRIVVLRKGEIVEQGTFNELMGKGGLFSKLYQTQFDYQTTGAGDSSESVKEETTD